MYYVHMLLKNNGTAGLNAQFFTK